MSQARKKRFDWMAFFWAFIAALVFFDIIYLYVIEMDYFNLYLDLQSMLIKAAIIGAIGGFLLSYLINLKTVRPYDKTRITLMGILVGLFMGPIALSLSNRKLDKNPVENKKVEIISIEPYLDAAYGIVEGQERKVKYYKLVFQKDGVTYTSHPPFLPQGVEAGTTASLPIHKGFWGFEWLELVN